MSAADVTKLAQRPMPVDPVEGRCIRIARGIKVQELADALGVHWVTVSAWERGVQKPRLGTHKADYARAIELLRLGLPNDHDLGGKSEAVGKVSDGSAQIQS